MMTLLLRLLFVLHFLVFVAFCGRVWSVGAAACGPCWLAVVQTEPASI
jgi:hypothetical protein